MPFDPYQSGDRDTLFYAVKESRQKLARFRRNRIDLISRYVGDKYRDAGIDFRLSGERKVFTNNLFAVAQVLIAEQASASPRVHISTPHAEYEAFAFHYKESLNRLVEEIGFEHENRLCVLEAFFSNFAVCKIYRSEFAAEMLRDEWQELGLPYAAHASFDDVTLDVTATKVRELDWIEHKYRMDVEDLADERYDQTVARRITPDAQFRKTRDPEGNERADEVEFDMDTPEISGKVWVREVWVPSTGQICLFSDDPSLDPLMCTEWTGPEGGPYEFLSFSDCPDNLFAPSLASVIEPVDIALNSMWRKLVRQAGKSKSGLIYDGSAEKDAAQVANMPDGGSTKVNNIDRVKMMVWNGIDQNNLAALPIFKNEFNRLAGNPELRAGVAPASGTLGQDKILMGNAGTQSKALEHRQADFLKRVFRKLGHLIWEDDQDQGLRYRDDRHGEAVSVGWNEMPREGKPSDYNFSIEPYSYRYQSPMEKQQVLDGIVNNPLIMQAAAQAGMVFDVQEYITTTAENTGVHEITRMFKSQFPPQLPRPGASETLQSPVTERHNVRHNAPPSEMDQMQEMLSSVPGGNGQAQGLGE